MYYLYFVSNPTGATLDVLERQDLNLVREVARIGLMGGAAALAMAARLSPASGVAVVSLAGCLTYVVYGGLSWRAVTDHRHRLGIGGASAADPSPIAAEWRE